MPFFMRQESDRTGVALTLLNRQICVRQDLASLQMVMNGWLRIRQIHLSGTKYHRVRPTDPGRTENLADRGRKKRPFGLPEPTWRLPGVRFLECRTQMLACRNQGWKGHSTTQQKKATRRPQERSKRVAVGYCPLRIGFWRPSGGQDVGALPRRAASPLAFAVNLGKTAFNESISCNGRMIRPDAHVRPQWQGSCFSSRSLKSGRASVRGLSGQFGDYDVSSYSGIQDLRALRQDSPDAPAPCVRF